MGDESLIKQTLSRHPHRSERIEIIHCEQHIPMDVKPRRALRDYPEASLPKAAALVGRDRGADALISAGNTGALVLSCAKFFERLEGVRRTALAAVIPTQRTHGSKIRSFFFTPRCWRYYRCEFCRPHEFCVNGCSLCFDY